MPIGFLNLSFDTHYAENFWNSDERFCPITNIMLIDEVIRRLANLCQLCFADRLISYGYRRLVVANDGCPIGWSNGYGRLFSQQCKKVYIIGHNCIGRFLQVFR